MAVFQFIEGFYNPSRRHSALGPQTLDEGAQGSLRVGVVESARACATNWFATISNGSRLYSARLNATAPSMEAISITAKPWASSLETPPSRRRSVN